jgi:hypothetical protein
MREEAGLHAQAFVGLDGAHLAAISVERLLTRIP